MTKMICTLIPAASGALTAQVTRADGTLCHLHSTIHPEYEHLLYADTTIWGETLLLRGCGLGYHLSTILENIPESITIICVDIFDVCTKAVISRLLRTAKNRIIICTPDNLKSQRSVLQEALSRKTQIIRHPASYDLDPEFYESITPFSRKDTASLGTVRVPLILFGAHFLQSECRNALHELYGTPPLLFEYEKHASNPAFQSALEKLLMENRPECILSINMTGLDTEGFVARLAEAIGIPIIIWFVDDPNPICLAHEKTITKSMIACCWEKAYLPFLQKKNFASVHYLPLAADPLLSANAQPMQTSYPVGFVGSPMGGEFLDNIGRKCTRGPDLYPFITELSESIACGHPIFDIDELASRIRASNSTVALPDNKNLFWLRSYIIHTGSMLKRKALAQALRDFPLHTFGDPEEWEKLIPGAVITHPSCDYRTQSSAIYKSIQVNINSTSCQMPTAVNQRVFDVPLCGSVLITDQQGALQELFDTTRECITYTSLEECKEKVRWALKFPQEAAAICTRAAQHILAEHTYVHRLKGLLKELGIKG